MEMKKKRIISGILSALLAFSLGGCRADVPDTSEIPNTPGPSPSPPVQESFPIPENYPEYTGQWQASEEPLTVYIDGINSVMVNQLGLENLEDVVSYLAGQDVNIEWVGLPKDKSEAEATLSRLRTELIAGKGPDLFLASCPSPFREDFGEYASGFFPNPEKTMKTDVFLPLDGLLENAQYMKADSLTKPILNAGRTQSGQVILPLSYTYYAMAFNTADLPDPDSLPTSWDALVEDDALKLGDAPLRSLCSVPDRLTDPSTGELLFTEDELLKWTTQAYSVVARSNGQEAGGAEPQLQEGVDSFFLSGAQSGKKTFLPSWNRSGGVTAFICSFAAVNKNTTQANNAMFLLDVLCSEQVITGKGFQEEQDGVTMNYGRFAWSVAGLDGIPIDNVKAVGPARTLVDQMDSHINAVRFYSDMDHVFADLAWIEGYLDQAPSDLDIKTAVSNAYAALEMLALE